MRFGGGVRSPAPTEILHYTGYDDDRGGIVSVVRNLAATGRFACVLGMNRGGGQTRVPELPMLELPPVAGEEIGWANFWRTRRAAQAVRAWLQAGPGRIFHGHSRAGLLVALWLDWLGEKRVVASVHCYGRQRWFYRWAARRLGSRLLWLSPAMKRYYAVGDSSWQQCIPGGVPAGMVTRAMPRPGVLRLGGIGALVSWKGWSTVLDAMALLPERQCGRVTFEHIGTGPAEQVEKLRRLATARGLGGQVAFRGAEPSSARLLGAVDALVVASVNEPFSLAVLEALAAGVPVIAADSGGATDVIQAGVNGRLYPTGDAGALRTVLAEWLESPPPLAVERIRETTVPVERTAAQWAEFYARL